MWFVEKGEDVWTHATGILISACGMKLKLRPVIVPDKGDDAWDHHFISAPTLKFTDQKPFSDKVTWSSWWWHQSISFAKFPVYLKRTNFRMYLFSQAKKTYFASTYFRDWWVFENFANTLTFANDKFLKIFWKVRVYKSQTQRKKNKKRKLNQEGI